MKPIVLFLVILCSLPVFALAKEAKSVSDDPELEKRVMALSEELRCQVCQNETLAGSHAELAADMRQLIREQMKDGKSDKEIVAFLTARYGKRIRYNPPFDPTTYFLWVGPFVLLLAGLALLFRYVKQRRELISEQPLSAEDRKRAEELLKIEPAKEPA
jgi:cytochrome c-type biogenesis protein CcmH